MTKVTEHFTLEELNCRCPRCKGKIPPSEIMANLKKLADTMEKFRVIVGKPIYVNSAYRCALHNAELPGAAKNSFHMQGLAMDFHIKGMTEQEMFELASGIKISDIPRRPAKTSLFKGVGYYPGQKFCHVDIAKLWPRPNTWEK